MTEQGEGDEVTALRAEVARMREQLAAAGRRAAGALASQQQLGLAMETIRQKNAELDRLMAELSTAREQEAARARELAASNARLRELVEQLSTPILQIGRDVLALPIVGAIDDERAAAIASRALDEIVARRARRVVLDLTGVATADVTTLGHVVRLIGAVRLLGARCVVCGLQPAVASALGELGAELRTIEAVRDLHAALS